MNEMVRLTIEASVIAQIILVILLFFSIVSWALIIDKVRIMRKVNSESKRFKHIFQMNNEWEQIYQKSYQYKFSPFANLFKTAYRGFYSQNNKPAEKSQSYQQAQLSTFIDRPNKTELLETLQSTANHEMASLEKSLIFLATTASASPFLGLFGTVWGVMSAFLNIGYKGSAELSVVGPGIAEALVTTAAGLAVAVPALIAYNYFVDRLRRLDGELYQFSTELIQTKEHEGA